MILLFYDIIFLVLRWVIIGRCSIVRLYIQGKNNLLKFNLPAKVDGSMLFSFKFGTSIIENSINVDAVDNKWVLKSNGNINVIGLDSAILPEIVLSDYMFTRLSIAGSSEYMSLFCLPSTENFQLSYDTRDLTNITIGKSVNNNIIYQHPSMADNHAIIKLDNYNWSILPATNDQGLYIYVNNQRVLKETPIFAGDIIFMNGLRIIWMKNSFIIPMANQLYKINGIKSSGVDAFTDNMQYTPVSETDSNLVLYNDDGRSLGSIDVVRSDAASSKGFSGVITASDNLRNVVTLKLENCTYNGSVVDAGIQAKLRI